MENENGEIDIVNNEINEKIKAREELILKILKESFLPKLETLEKRNNQEMDILKHTVIGKDYIIKLINQSQLLNAKIQEALILKNNAAKSRGVSRDINSRNVSVRSNLPLSKAPISRNKSRPVYPSDNTSTLKRTNDRSVRPLSKPSTTSTTTALHTDRNDRSKGKSLVKNNTLAPCKAYLIYY